MPPTSVPTIESGQSLLPLTCDDETTIGNGETNEIFVGTFFMFYYSQTQKPKQRKPIELEAPPSHAIQNREIRLVSTTMVLMPSMDVDHYAP